MLGHVIGETRAQEGSGVLAGLLLPRREPTVWHRGAIEEVAFALSANHGGGYLYSVCPAGEPLTEACFMKTPLDFNRSAHRSALRFLWTLSFFFQQRLWTFLRSKLL